jgi:hypothetical protein
MRFPVVTLLLTALIATSPAEAHAATFATPVEPFVVDRGCDYGDTTCSDPTRHHAGVDLLPDESPEPVLASADGIVRIAESDASDASHDFGNVVVLEHTLPDGTHVSTVYGHMRDVPVVRPGGCIRRGTRLGTVGMTGAADNVVHVHFEVKTTPTLGPPYGYTWEYPDQEGFYDPKLFVGTREASDICPAVSEPLSDCAAGQPRAAFAGIASGTAATRVGGRVRRLAAFCRIQVSLVRARGGRCAYWRESRGRMEQRACDSPLWTTVHAVNRGGGLARWSHSFRARLARGPYEVRLRLVDARHRVHVPGGRVSTGFSRP